jgi:DNA-binding NarL/FixJ family response regulator
VIETTVVDDHPAVRAGLAAWVTREPGFHLAAEVATAAEALGASSRLTMDLVIADYHLCDGDGIALCRTLKRRHGCAHAVLYSGFADERVVVAATVAGLDAVIHKGIPAPTLFDLLRQVVRGQHPLGPFDRNALRAVNPFVAPEDVPVIALRLDGASEADVADALGIGLAEAEFRINRSRARRALGNARERRPASPRRNRSRPEAQRVRVRGGA